MYLQWKEADQNELMDSKLKCVFALPPGLEQNNLEEKYEQQGYDNARSQVAATPAQAEAKVRFRLENIRTVLLILFFLHHAALQYEGYNHFLELEFIVYRI